MNFDGLKTIGTFSAGAAVVGLMTQQPHYYEAWSGAIFLTVFWRTLARLARNVHNDYQAWRLTAGAIVYAVSSYGRGNRSYRQGQSSMPYPPVPGPADEPR